jgi:hypothetical protein
MMTEEPFPYVARALAYAVDAEGGDRRLPLRPSRLPAVLYRI